MHTCRTKPCHAKPDIVSVLVKDRIGGMSLNPLESQIFEDVSRVAFEGVLK